MHSFVVLTENDESNWLDQTGVLYHFPPRYKKLIEPGTHVVYYKGRLSNPQYKSMRLSDEPHYFGVGIIEKIWPDTTTKNYFASIKDFRLFTEAVPFKVDGEYLELKANDVKYNYFRGNGVRSLTEEEFKKITQGASKLESQYYKPEEEYDQTHISAVPEGKQIRYYATKYERIRSHRDAALKIHGYNCIVCNLNFKEVYGELGEGYIHIHHTKPLSSLDEVTVPDPRTDLVPVCPNCHAMLHRKKGVLLSIAELKELYKGRNQK
jgi:putative restriction endonuclease